MRNFTNSAMSVNYPDNIVFSGDLNLINVTKLTTATFVEISFSIDGYAYAENIYFFSSDVSFSISEILNLLFSRTSNSNYTTRSSFSFTLKLYNNTSLIDTESFTIGLVLLGKRKIFDKLGTIPNLSEFEYCPDLGISQLYYYFEHEPTVNVVLQDDSVVALEDINQNMALISFSEYDVKSIYYIVNNFLKNPSMQYLGGVNFWTTGYPTFMGCGSYFGISTIGGLKFVLPDDSCGNIMTTEYNGGTFVSGVTYTFNVTVASITNPGLNEYIFTFDLGGNTFDFVPIVGINSFSIVCGGSGRLSITGFMDSDTSGYGAHSMVISEIIVKDLIHNPINLVSCCANIENKIQLRYLNRFGFWRYTIFEINTEKLATSNGILLDFISGNFTEYNGLSTEQQKRSAQSLNIFKDGVNNELKNDLIDIMSSDHVHIYDAINSVYIPVIVQTNSYIDKKKDTSFDFTLSINLLNG